MATAFNLTAELNLRGPSNLRQVVGNIRQQLSGLSLNLSIDPRTASNVSTISRNVNDLSRAATSATRDVAALDAALRRLGVGANSTQRTLNSLSRNINTVNRSISSSNRVSQQAASGMETFGRQAGLAIKRFAAFTVVTAGVYGFSRALSSAYKEFVTFNKELVRLQQVTEGTVSSLTGLVSEITNVSQRFGVSSSDILSASVTLAQAGLSATQTKVALEALAKSALAPSFDSLNNTVEGSIALMRQFGIESNQLEGALGSINAVAAKFAVEAGDIIGAIQRTGGVFAAASRGVSEGTDALNEFIAVFTSIRATTRESAETIATGLRTIFSRIQRGETINALKEYGVTLTDVEGKFVGAYKAVQLLSEGLSKLDPRDLRFSAIVEELGGFRQVGKVIPLIQQFATAQQALGVAQRGAGSLAIDAAIAQQALSVKITKVREEFIALIRDIGQSQSFQKLVDMSLMLASALIRVADAAKDVLPAIAAIGAIRGLGGITNFARGFGRGLRGGNARGFASGGMVPGTGSGDTVPAMLTPGEFVIRKNAVQSIGTGNLHKMNKYASGGHVQKFAQPIPKYNSGLVKTEDRIKQNMIGQDNKYKFGLVGLRSGTSKGPSVEPLSVSIGKAPRQRQYNVQLHKAPLSKIYANKIDQKIEAGIKKDYTSSVKSTASILSKDLMGQQNYSKSNLNKALKGNALYAVIGSIFEAGLTAVGSPYLEKSEKTKSMDFPFGLGAIASKFKIPGNIPTDATRTIGGRGKGNSQMRQQIKRFITATEKGYFSQAENKALMRKQVAAGNLSRVASTTRMAPFLKQAGKGGLAGFIGRTLSGQQNIRSFLQKHGLDRNDLKKVKNLDSISGWSKFGGVAAKEDAFINDVKKIFDAGAYAKGGSVDTVPAMLTPGEFVINKKAATRIGSTQLNRLNQADKIQGFNKGGSVGGVQHMAAGGIVGVFSGLARVIRDLTTRMKLLTMNVPQGAGWTGAGVTPLNQVTNGGVPNNRAFQNNTRGRLSRVALDPMSLLLSAGFIGDSVGGGMGGALTGGAINAGIVGSLGQGIGLPPGLNNAVTIIAGLIGAIDGYSQAIDKGIIEKNNADIETFTKTLETSFKQLSNQVNVTAIDLQNVGGIISRLGVMEAENRQVITRQARGENLAGMIGRQFQAVQNALFGKEGLILRGEEAVGANVNQPQLARDLLANSRQQAEGINQAVQVGLKRGFSIKDIFKNLQGSGIKPDDIRRSMAILQDGLEISTREAKIEAMRQRGELPENIQLEEKALEQRINALSREYVKQAVAANKTTTAIKGAVTAIDLFNTKLRQIIDRISAIDAVRQEDFRQIEIAVGSRMGDTGFAAPSELPVRVLENASAFSEDTVLAVVNRLGNNLGIDPGTQDRLTNNLLAQRELQNELPTLLGELANAKPEDVGGAQSNIRQRITEILAPFDLPNVDEVLKSIMAKLEENISGDKPLSELANDTTVLQNILQVLGSSTEVLVTAQKAYDNQLKQTQQALNKLADTLSQIDELRINANTIMIEGDINLRRALGMDVPLADMNRPFDQSILGLTNVIDPKTGRRQGGTLDPAEIAARREQAEKTKARLENNQPLAGDAAAVEAHSQALLRSERNIRNLDKAQQKLANDSTRAANALAKIQELRQLDQKRGEAFFDLAGNINDPQWVNQFLQEFGSFQRVMSGQGNLADLQGAINTFNRRAQVLPEDQRNTEQFRLAQELARIMAASGGGAGPTAQQLMQTFFPGGANGITPQIQAAIDAYNDAIQVSVDATNYLADTLEDGADIFYDKVMKAARDFGLWIGQVINNLNNGRPIPRPVDAELLSKGGPIYASKGQFVNFQPRGTDTVPAMLTPGEFVVNAKATRKNLGLLKAINSHKSSKVGGFSRGGAVYLNDGGLVPDVDTYNVDQLGNLIQFKMDQVANIQNRLQNTKDLAEIDQANKEIARLNAEIDVMSKRKAYMEQTGRGPEKNSIQRDMDRRDRDKRVAEAKAANREGQSPPPGYSSWDEYDSTPEKQKEEIAKTNREAKNKRKAEEEAHQKRQSGAILTSEEQDLAFAEENRRIDKRVSRQREALHTGQDPEDTTGGSLFEDVDKDRQASGRDPLFDSDRTDDIRRRAEEKKAKREKTGAIRPDRKGKNPPYGIPDWDTYDAMTNAERQKTADADRQLKTEQKRFAELSELYDINDPYDYPRDPKDSVIWEKGIEQKRQKEKEETAKKIYTDMEEQKASEQADRERKREEDKKAKEAQHTANQAAFKASPEYQQFKEKTEATNKALEVDYKDKKTQQDAKDDTERKADEQARVAKYRREIQKNAELTQIGLSTGNLREDVGPRRDHYASGAQGSIEYSKELMAFSKAESEAFQLSKTKRAEDNKKKASQIKREKEEEDAEMRPIRSQKYNSKDGGQRTLQDELDDARSAEQSSKANAAKEVVAQGFLSEVVGGKDSTYREQGRRANINIEKINQLQDRLKKATTQDEIHSIRSELRTLRGQVFDQAQQAVEEAKTAGGVGTGKEGKFNESKNVVTRTVGNIGGALQGVEESAYGAANVVGGTAVGLTSSVSGGLGYAFSGAGDIKTSDGKVKQANKYNESEFVAAERAAAEVGAKAVVAGVSGVAEGAQAVVGQGPIQAGEETTLQKNDAENQAIASRGGMGNLTAAAQFASRTSAGVLLEAGIEAGAARAVGRGISAISSSSAPAPRGPRGPRPSGDDLMDAANDYSREMAQKEAERQARRTRTERQVGTTGGGKEVARIETPTDVVSQQSVTRTPTGSQLRDSKGRFTGQKPGGTFEVGGDPIPSQSGGTFEVGTRPPSRYKQSGYDDKSLDLEYKRLDELDRPNWYKRFKEELEPEIKDDGSSFFSTTGRPDLPYTADQIRVIERNIEVEAHNRMIEGLMYGPTRQKELRRRAVLNMEGRSSFSTTDSLPSGPLQMPGMPSAPPAGVKGRGTTTDYTMTVGPQKPVRGTTTTLNQRPQSNMGSGSDSFSPTIGGPGSSNIRTRSDSPMMSRTIDKPLARPTMSQMDTGIRPTVLTEKDVSRLARGDLDDPIPTAPKPTPTPTKQTTTPSASRNPTKKGGSTTSSARRTDEFPLGKTSGKQRNVGRLKKGQSGVTGWKQAIKAGGDTPEQIAKNNAKIKKYLEENYPDQWKEYADFYRLYNLEGSLDEAQAGASKISSEIGDLLDKKFVYENDVGADALTREFTPGISGRFDIDGTSAAATKKARTVYSSINRKPIDGLELPYAQQPAGVLNSAVGTDSYTLGNRLTDRVDAVKRSIKQTTDPAEIKRLNQILKQEEDALRKSLTKTYPEYAGSAGGSAITTSIPPSSPKPGGSATRGLPSFSDMIPGLDPVSDVARNAARRSSTKLTPGGQRRQTAKDVSATFNDPGTNYVPPSPKIPKKGSSSKIDFKPDPDQPLSGMTLGDFVEAQKQMTSQKPKKGIKQRLIEGTGFAAVGSATLGGGALYMDTRTKTQQAVAESRKTDERVAREAARVWEEQKLFIQKEKERAEEEERRQKQAGGLYKGGVVYASKGTLVPYQPRGTDTVPAMLTPGEFVVNRAAARDNMGLLKAINNGQYLRSGGIVKPKYLEDGGIGGGIGSSSSSGGVSLSIDTGNFDSGVKTFDSSISAFSTTIGSFAGAVSTVSTAISSIGNLDFSSLNGTFEAINSSVSLLSGSAAGFSQVLNQFNSSVTSLQSALGNVKDINLNVTGSIPVDVNVNVNGGDGLQEQLKSFGTQIYNEIATEISKKTNGGIKLDIRSN